MAMVCISCLELSGSPSHLRYLLRRLRQHLPSVDVPVLIGFWPDGEEILHDERRRVAVGADYYTSSLRDAVDACLEVAQKASVGEQFQSIPASIVDTVEGEYGLGCVDTKTTHGDRAETAKTL